MRADNPQKKKKEQKKGLFYALCLCLNVFSTDAADESKVICVPVYPEFIPQWGLASHLAAGSEGSTLSLLEIGFSQEMTTYLQHIYCALRLLSPFFPSVPAPDLVTFFIFWRNPKISTSTLI